MRIYLVLVSLFIAIVFSGCGGGGVNRQGQSADTKSSNNNGGFSIFKKPDPTTFQINKKKV